MKILKLTKHFGNLSAGEVGGYSDETAAHILKHQGAELIGECDPTKQVVVKRDDRFLIVDAEPELRDGKPTGNLVEKRAKAAPRPAA